ncbi:MAG: hypothetical protein M0P49_04430 [Bacilli bacterium]|nr:hypothetical protein [Bacilli bacterium]
MAQQYNNNRKPNNYFTQQIQKNGVNFLDTARDDNLARDCVRIFRDLARGNIDITQYGDYFLNPRLISAAISTAYSKQVLYGTSKAGMDLLINSPMCEQNFPHAPVVMNSYSRSFEAYSLILENLIALKNTGNIDFLNTLVSNINKYRNDI